jgi:hypothetical protein
MTGSSPEPNTSVEKTEQTETDVSATSASSPEEQKGEKSLLESVQAALKDSKAESSPDSSPEPDKPGAVSPDKPATSVADEPLGDPTPEELKTYTPKTRQRVQQLLRERHDLEQRATAAEEKAARFDQIIGYTEANRLSHDDVAAIFEIGALVKNDPEKAYDKVLPVFVHLSKLTGRVLPPDVQERVNLGYLPQSDAQELVRLQTQATLREQRAAEQVRRATETEQRVRAEEVNRTVQAAAVDWETRQAQSDPDWSSKKDLVRDAMQAAVVQEGYPTDAAAVGRLLNGALTKVNAQLAHFRPRPKAMAPVLGSTSTSALSEPKTALEAARRALGDAR